MKIGVLTVPFNNNYGGLLQAYALKTVLTDMGHEVLFINRQRNIDYGLKFRIYRLLVKLHIIKDYLKIRDERLSANTNKFKDRYLSPITKPFYTTSDLEEVMNQGVDCFVVGSDQVWRYLYAGDSIDDYYFGFLRGSHVPRFSYAASFGVDVNEYPEEKRQVVTGLLKQFEGISVREKSGKKILEDFFEVPSSKSEVVLDPTLLLGQDRYTNLFKDEMVSDSRYIFTYILDSNPKIDEKLNIIAASKGLKRIDIKAQTGDTSKLNVIEPVEKWLSTIYHADFVITDSFHGSVFSIIFKKKFAVLLNANRGNSRISDLLSELGLNNRIMQSIDDLNSDYLSHEIEWNKIVTILMHRNEESLKFLKNQLNRQKSSNDIYSEGIKC